jgi:GTP-binding protein EngB required for normal cell division
MSEIDSANVPLAEEQSGELRRYLKLRLDLAGVIRSVMELFRQAKDPREHQARFLLSRLAEDRFNLAVVGQFKRGKSSLMNAVIGMDRLPTGILPITSVVTTVRYGDHESVLIRSMGSVVSREIPLARLEEYVTEKGNPGNHKHVEVAEVLLPSEILRLGFHFIDTPGVGSSIAENTATTHRFLPEADAVVFVTSFESTMNEGELAFLRAVTRHVHKIFFVVNKFDLVSTQESETVMASVRETISSELGSPEARVFAVSARWGLEAKLSGNREMLDRSGFPELESALTHFLTSQKQHVSLLRCVERATALLTLERVESCAGEIRAVLTGEALRTRKHEWQVKMQQFEKECVHKVKALRRRVRSELPLCFDLAIAEHCTKAHDSLVTQVDSFLEARKKSITAQDLRELVNRAGSVVDELRRQWFSSHQADFIKALWSLMAKDMDQLERMYGKALDLAAELFGMQPIAKWTVSKDEANLLWRTSTPFEWRPRFAWELDVFPVRWVRGRVRRDYCRTLEVATTAYRERVVQALAESGSEWVGRLSSVVQDGLKDLDIRITDVLSGQAASAVSREVVTVLSRLEEMREELTHESRDKATILSPIPVQRSAISRCLICTRIEAELFDFFSKRQYELSVNETEQGKHAALGGFCPLHTWQYARIASPQGISLAYAPVLTAIAHNLRDIASSASSAGSMWDHIRRLHPSVESCPACRRTVEAEEMAIEEYRKASPRLECEEPDAGLCVSHLAAVVNRETDLETARKLVLKQGNALKRISEDMQTYSLKHDALRRELASDEELMAYFFGLSLLVGHKGLSVA